MHWTDDFSCAKNMVVKLFRSLRSILKKGERKTVGLAVQLVYMDTLD